MSPRTTADVIVEGLEAAGVRVIFGLPGEENLPLVSAIDRSDIELVVCRHEQHASFMAVAHARLTDDLAVCMATLGPGALNLFTGLAQAELLNVPVLAITGQKPAVDNDEGPFQVVDVVGSARAIVHQAVAITDPNTAGPVLDDIITSTIHHRRAALIELPEDVAAAPNSGAAPTITPVRRPRAADDLVAQLQAKVQDAERPLLLAGSGCANNQVASALAELGDRTGLPVVTTQMGKGALRQDHPVKIGSLGMHRPDYVNAVIDDADLVVAVGYQPVEHPPRAWHRRPDQQVVHVHDHPAHRVVGHQPELEVLGDITHTLSAIDLAGSRNWAGAYRRAIGACLDAETRLVSEISAAHVPSRIAAAVDADTVVALDNGLYKLWFSRLYPTGSAHSLLMDNALATMGAGLATGMAAARLGRKAVVVTGDGGFLMNGAELETAKRLGLELTVVVLRDDAFGFIEWHQAEQGRNRVGVHVSNPDIATLARAFGAHAVAVAGPGELPDAVSTARGLTVIDCPIDYACNELLERDDLPDVLRTHMRRHGGATGNAPCLAADTTG